MILNKIVHWVRNFFFLPMKAMPRELDEKYDMRRESYVGTLKRDYSPATGPGTLQKAGSKRTLKSLVGIFNLSHFR